MENEPFWDLLSTWTKIKMLAKENDLIKHHLDELKVALKMVTGEEWK